MTDRLLLTITITAILSIVYAPACAQTNTGKQLTPKPTVTSQDTINGIQYEQRKPIEQKIRNSAELEVDGLIVDETITKIGRDFYDIFHQNWEAPTFAKNFTILIKELPTRGNGALVQLSINEELIFEQLLQPRYDIIYEIASYAVAVSFEYLENNTLKQQLDADGKRAIEKF